MISLLLAAALFVAPPAPAVQMAENTAVIVSGQVSHHSGAYCSGVIIYSKGTEEMVLTARHCVRQEPDEDFETKPESVQFFDGDVALVKSVTQDANADLAVMTVVSMRRHPYAMVGPVPMRGDPAFAFGYSVGRYWVYSPAQFVQGSVYADDLEDERFANTVRLTCQACGPGSSGGALFDRSGRVTAIISGGNAYEMLAIPSPTVAAFLKGLR